MTIAMVTSGPLPDVRRLSFDVLSGMKGLSAAQLGKRPSGCVGTLLGDSTDSMSSKTKNPPSPTGVATPLPVVRHSISQIDVSRPKRQPSIKQPQQVNNSNAAVVKRPTGSSGIDAELEKLRHATKAKLMRSRRIIERSIEENAGLKAQMNAMAFELNCVREEKDELAKKVQSGHKEQRVENPKEKGSIEVLPSEWRKFLENKNISTLDDLTEMMERLKSNGEETTETGGAETEALKDELAASKEKAKKLEGQLDEKTSIIKSQNETVRNHTKSIQTLLGSVRAQNQALTKLRAELAELKREKEENNE